MSFAMEVKEDLLKVNNSSSMADRLEIEAMLRLGGEIVFGMPMRLTFTCNNMGITRRFITLVKKYYEIEYEIQSRVINRFENSTTFTCIISNANDIIKDMNLIGSESELREKLFDNDDWMTAYLRGSFFVRGTVNDPQSKNSHLEISSTSESEILFIQKLMNHFELNARIAKRKNYLISYIKSKEAIGDFLYRVGATSSMTYYEDVIITKEIATNAKRTINLDLANQDKTNDAALEQLKYIKYLEYNYPLERMDPKILMIMKVRKEHPEHSLTQLLDVIHDDYEPELSKSGLNHRLRKIKEMAKELAEKKKDRL